MAHQGSKFFPLLSVPLALASCASPSTAIKHPSPRNDVSPVVPPARIGQAGSPVSVAKSGGQAPRYGNGVFVRQPESTAQPAGAPAQGAATGPDKVGRDFQFRDAPIDLVLNQVLGEAFGLSFAVDPNVQGRLTIRIDGIVDGPSAVAALDGALRLQGVSITSNGSGYLVTKTTTGGGAGNFQILASPDDKPSSEAAVLVLRYASADEVARLAKPLFPDNVVKLADASRGIIVLQGAPRDVSAAVTALRSFDVDWFASTSSAFVQLQNSTPEEVKAELDQLFNRTGGVEVIALQRLGAVMVFTRSRELMDRVQVMLADLDRTGQGAIQNDTLIYEARYVSAERLQSVAGALFGIPGSAPVTGSSTPAAAPVTAPTQPLKNTEVSVAIDEASNLVVVQGRQDDLARINDLFQRIDKPQKQVLIEATIVEVTLRDEFRLGVQWDGVTKFLNATYADNSSGTVASKFPGTSVVYSNVDITAVLNALDAETDVQVVSSPRILALNNQSARIQVGDQVPIVTQSAVSVNDPGAPIVNSTSYRDTGIILSVTPHVRAGDMIEIEVSQEVSDVSETVTSGIDSPTISTRRMDGVLAVPSGATVALGGMISSNHSKSVSGVPILKDIPVLGAAFSSQADILRKTELVVLLRPVLLDSVQPEVDLSSALVRALERVKPGWIEG